MNKGFIISGIALLAMLGCGIGYTTSPNYVAEDGTLVETFGFIPLFWLSAIIFIASLIVGFYLYAKSKKA